MRAGLARPFSYAGEREPDRRAGDVRLLEDLLQSLERVAPPSLRHWVIAWTTALTMRSVFAWETLG